MHGHDGRSGTNAGGTGRRAFLTAAGSAVAGVIGTAGCLGSAETVSVLAAGSLAVALEDGVGPAVESEHDLRYDGEYHGTNALLRMVENGTKRPDVVLGADVGLLRERLYPDHAAWDVTVAANELVIAYAPDTELGDRLAADEPWYDVLADADDGELAISDPDLDPLGYRAILLFELAEREHDREGFRDAIVERAYREPDEPQLLAGLESGNRACAICYRNMAVERDLPFRELADAYNFGDPAHAPAYERATYTTDDGHTVRGRPIVYNATVRTGADEPEAGREFVAFLLENATLLEERGLRVPETVPQTHGDTPETIVP